MENYECVTSFCYLGDTLDGDGGADLAATARIRNGWMKFWKLLPFLTVPYGSGAFSLEEGRIVSLPLPRHVVRGDYLECLAM